MMKLTLSVVVVALVTSACSQSAAPPRSASPVTVVGRFQAKWLTTDTPKLAVARKYWDSRVAEAANVSASQQSATAVSQELGAVAPNVRKQLTLFGSVDAVRKADTCDKVVVRGERGGGLPKIVAYLDAKSGEMLLVLFYNEG